GPRYVELAVSGAQHDVDGRHVPAAGRLVGGVGGRIVAQVDDGSPRSGLRGLRGGREEAEQRRDSDGRVKARATTAVEHHWTAIWTVAASLALVPSVTM